LRLLLLLLSSLSLSLFLSLSLSRFKIVWMAIQHHYPSADDGFPLSLSPAGTHCHMVTPVVWQFCHN
jgi:hypothetical protein